MPKLQSSQHGPFTGVDASSGAYVNPQGTVPRASNLISIQRGSLATCDGSTVLAWHSGQIQSGDSKIIALSVFQPTGVSPYYLALKQTDAFPLGPGYAEAAVASTVPLAANSTLTGGSHSYVITTIDGIGGESNPTPAVTATGNPSIKVTWNGVANAFGYNIYRDDQLLTTAPGVGTPCGGPPFAPNAAPNPAATATLPILQTCGLDSAGTQTYQFAYIDTGAAVPFAPATVIQADTLVNQAGVVQFTVASTINLPPGQAFTVFGLTDINGNPVLNGTYIITNIVNSTTFQAVPVGVIPAPVIPPPPPPPPPNVPGITLINPTMGVAGNIVTITGTNFGTTQLSGSTVTFNGTTASVTNWTNTSILAAVPSGVTSGPVIVTVGGQASNGVTFTVTPNTIPAPVITSLNQTTGVAGDTITITGTNFGAMMAGAVTFNGVQAAVTNWTDTSITVTVPSGVTTGNVVVIAHGQSSNGVLFTVSGTTGTSIALVSIVGGITIPGGPYNGQPGLSLILQTPWSPSVPLAVGNTVTVSGTSLYNGSRVVAGLSPGPDNYGMTLVAVTGNTTIVLLQGQVTLP